MSRRCGWTLCLHLFWVGFFIFCLSCARPQEQPGPEKKNEVQQEKRITPDEAVGGLHCFKCHSYQKFTYRQKGAFPHAVHLGTGYHCNQCHSFQDHRYMKTATHLCKDCHDLKTISFAATDFPSRFNHSGHAKFGCKECHNRLFLMKKGTTSITMAALYEGRYCGACHDGKKAFSSSECGLCHEMKEFQRSVSYKVENIGDVSFSHAFHTKVASCSDCHAKLFEMKKTQKKMTMAALYEGKYCGACHNGKMAFASNAQCERCHAEVKEKAVPRKKKH